MLLSVQTTFEVEPQRVTDLVVNCFEGGYSPWIEKVRTQYDGGLKLESPWYSDVRYWTPETFPRPWAWLWDEEGKKHVLDNQCVMPALKLMAKKYPRHWTDFIQENDDAITADVFMQLMVLRDVVYG